MRWGVGENDYPTSWDGLMAFFSTAPFNDRRREIDAGIIKAAKRCRSKCMTLKFRACNLYLPKVTLFFFFFLDRLENSSHASLFRWTVLYVCMYVCMYMYNAALFRHFSSHQKISNESSVNTCSRAAGSKYGVVLAFNYHLPTCLPLCLLTL